MIIAKPVINDRFWIIKDGDVKIGEMQRAATGVKVVVGRTESVFRTVSLAEERLNLQVDKTPLKKTQATQDYFAGLPVDGEVHNPIYDLRLRVPLYTKDAKSKSQFAAGWYRIKQSSTYEWVLCPKLIMLQRYPWQGPFEGKDDSR